MGLYGEGHIELWDTENMFAFNSLSTERSLDWTKFKAFTVDKSNVAESMISVSDR